MASDSYIGQCSYMTHFGFFSNVKEMINFWSSTFISVNEKRVILKSTSLEGEEVTGTGGGEGALKYMAHGQSKNKTC